MLKIRVSGAAGKLILNGVPFIAFVNKVIQSYATINIFRKVRRFKNCYIALHYKVLLWRLKINFSDKRHSTIFFHYSLCN